ncbi:MAG: multi-sensor hybrid histidine kinase [Fibrobacteres bacterium]|nr:multi-sensor hybrid histidine kinase [Fibrobacterota bacterium]
MPDTPLEPKGHGLREQMPLPAKDEVISLLRIELAAVKEILQTVRERYEAVSANSQAAHERSEAANEGLKSANEKLETANEELRTRNIDHGHLNDNLRIFQLRLQESGDYARSIVDTVREPLLVLDGEARVESANPSFYRTFQVSPEETEGVLLYNLGNGQWDIPQLRSLLEHILPQNTSVENFEMKHVFPGLGSRVMMLNARRLLQDDGRTQLMLLAIEDITERRRVEEALHETEEKLRQAQRMEAIGKLAGGIAHDFNNMLTAINGYSALCLTSAPPEGDLHEHLEEIHKAGERAASLTRQLLAYSRKQVLLPKVFDLNAIVSNMHNMLTRLIGERFRLDLSLDHALGLVKADPGQMEQVLINLVVNARDALPNGGVISLRTWNKDVVGDFSKIVPTAPRGAYVALSVSDNGIGMASDVQSRIFEPFYTTKPLGMGTGLGLSVVQGIISQSGGFISVKSEMGIGTEFNLFLPKEKNKEVPALRDDGTDAKPQRATETVLLVEDEETVRKFIRKVLEIQGYKVLESDNGGNALRLSEQCKDMAIDILLTDMIMPGMGGRELAERFCASRPQSRVLYMSGYTEDTIFNRNEELQRGGHFIQKPFNPADLAKSVREALAPQSKGSAG